MTTALAISCIVFLVVSMIAGIGLILYAEGIDTRR